MNKKQLLQEWHQKMNYRFPWRKNKSIYKVWISEIMLQQTQVSTVIKYYDKWITRYPNLKILSTASLDDLLKLCEGLGYYRRLQNIYKTSQKIKKKYNYHFPKRYVDLIKLDGIGDYTASAILSIGYNKPYPAIDSNLKRVLTRIHGILPAHQTLGQYKTYAKTYMSYQYPNSIIQEALMDLGREICKQKKPLCNKCPIAKMCKAKTLNAIKLFTSINKQKKQPKYKIVVGIIYKNNKFIITKRPPNGLLGNLWELPGGKMEKNESEKDCLEREIKEELNIKVNDLRYLGNIKHAYSHFKVEMRLFECQYKSGVAKPMASQDIKWISINHIKDFAFPKANHKLFTLIT